MEQYIYHNRYGLGEYTTEEPLCIVATGRSPELLQTYQQFFDSLFRQNYTDYAVVFGHLNFDGETDAKMKKYIEEKEGDFAKKFRTFRDYSEPMKQGLFQIKSELIKNYCKKGELIVDVDAGDELIGIQALGLINTVFQANPELWFLIANSLYEDGGRREKQDPACIAEGFQVLLGSVPLRQGESAQEALLRERGFPLLRRDDGKRGVPPNVPVERVAVLLFERVSVLRLPH